MEFFLPKFQKKFLLIINHGIGTKKKQEMIELANKSSVKIANKGLNQGIISKFAGKAAGTSPNNTKSKR